MNDKRVEVVTIFSREGEIIPYRIRFFHEKDVQYKTATVQNIFYVEKNKNYIKYSVEIAVENKDDNFDLSKEKKNTKNIEKCILKNDIKENK